MKRATWRNPAPDASPSRMTTGESYTASISAADRYPKPLQYRLVDLLGDEGISEDQIEAIRVVLNFVCTKLGKEALASARGEIEKLQQELDEAGKRETRYRNGLSLLLHADAPEAEIAARALYGEAYTGPSTAELERRIDAGGQGVDLSKMPVAEIRDRLLGTAQADRNPEGHDPAEGHGRNDESRVAATSGDAPKPDHSNYSPPSRGT